MGDFGQVDLTCEAHVLVHPEDLRTTVHDVTKLGQLCWLGSPSDPLQDAPRLWTLLVGCHEEILPSGDRGLAMGDKSMAIAYYNPQGGMPALEGVNRGKALEGVELARSLEMIVDPLTAVCVVPELVDQIEAAIAGLHKAAVELLEDHSWDRFATTLAMLANEASRGLAVPRG